MSPASVPLIVISIIVISVNEVTSHGRLVEPPSRSSMWRYGFKTKPNYNDNELFCGGYTVHWQRNGGKCGICGDAWHLPSPRPNEAGGIYGQGIIVRKYSPGQVIKSTVEITANHRGFFEFKLCPQNDPSEVASQECLDHYPLELADGSGTKYYPAVGTGPFSALLKLPDHLTCSQCVFQWTYTAGNNWGKCENGTSKVGCGPQETFRGCSDVAIGDVETNDIPTYQDRPVEKPSISAIPSRRTTYRPVYRPRTSRPSYIKPTYFESPYDQPINNRPIDNRPSHNRPPIFNRPPYSKPVDNRPAYNKPPTASKPAYERPSSPRRPFYYAISTKKPYSRKPRPTRIYHKPNREHTTRQRISRPTVYASIYTPKPTPYRPIQTSNSITNRKKSSWPVYGEKMVPQRTTNFIESEASGGKCRAVGVWSSVSGIAGWCDTNCARGYCPVSHCDCS